MQMAVKAYRCPCGEGGENSPIRSIAMNSMGKLLERKVPG
jgi:hypothetical protein